MEQLELDDQDAEIAATPDSVDALPIGSNHLLSFENLFSVDALRKTWSRLRKEVRLVSARDVVDWADWSVTLDSTLPQLREDVLDGTFRPTQPTRFEQGKGKGAFRVISALNIRDALVYRHICDLALERGLPEKVKGAFFSRRHSTTPVGNTFSLKDDPYMKFFTVWLRYNEYRSRTLLNDIYNVLVITDISNYFDSIQHDLLFEYLAPLGLPRKAAGLLGRLLEAFKPDAEHSPNPRVGIPMDEFDCSRELAHVFLFEHDRRVTAKFGEDHYVRWMDDQNVGVRSEAEGRLVVNMMTRSLASQRLSLNSGKTLFLDPSEVVVHFQLDANERISQWEEAFKGAKYKVTEELENDFRQMHTELRDGKAAERGNWDKILKRLYAVAIRVNVEDLEVFALDDLVRFPQLAERIFDYHAKRNRGLTLLGLFEKYRLSRENLFEATEAAFFESALLLDIEHGTEVDQAYRHTAEQFARCELEGQTGRPLGRASATLLLYWLGTGSDALRDLYGADRNTSLPKEVARAWMATVAATEPLQLGSVLSSLFGHQSDDVARLGSFLTELLRGRIESLGAYKHLRPRWPLPRKYYDARAWLLWELASHGKHDRLRQSLRKDAKAFYKVARTRSERAIFTRTAERLGANTDGDRV